MREVETFLETAQHRPYLISISSMRMMEGTPQEETVRGNGRSGAFQGRCAISDAVIIRHGKRARALWIADRINATPLYVYSEYV